MLIDETGLLRAIKSAHKHGGYTVANQGEIVAIYTENWFIQCKRARAGETAIRSGRKQT